MFNNNNKIYIYIHFDFSQGETKEASNKVRGRQTLEKWLNKSMKIKMSDGRTLIGMPRKQLASPFLFVC